MNEIDPDNSDIVNKVVQAESVGDDAFESDPAPLGSPVAVPPTQVPGPGLPESLGWTISCFVVQIIATIVAVIGYSVYTTLTQGADVQDVLKSMQADFGVGMIASVQAAFVLYALVAVTLRVGRPWSSKLNLSPIDPLHFVLILVMLLPLSQISGAFYMGASELWGRIVDILPFLSALDQANTMEMIGQFADKMSLPVMLLVIAVAPAIGEELIFRGLIGRGLIARWGLLRGVLITSLLFAAIHLHPAHACGVIPLGIAFHVVYITTRSFWAPVLLHFSNNAMATLAAKLMDKEQMQQAVEGGGELSIPLVLAATATVFMAGFVMWKTRVQHIDSDGTVWDPGYPTVERPPMDLQTRVSRGSVHWASVALVLICLIGFFTIAGMEGAERLAK